MENHRFFPSNTKYNTTLYPISAHIENRIMTIMICGIFCVPMPQTYTNPVSHNSIVNYPLMTPFDVPIANRNENVTNVKNWCADNDRAIDLVFVNTNPDFVVFNLRWSVPIEILILKWINGKVNKTTETVLTRIPKVLSDANRNILGSLVRLGTLCSVQIRF